MVIQALDFFKHSCLYYSKVPNTSMSIKYIDNININIINEKKSMYIYIFFLRFDYFKVNYSIFKPGSYIYMFECDLII